MRKTRFLFVLVAFLTSYAMQAQEAEKIVWRDSSKGVTLIDGVPVPEQALAQIVAEDPALAAAAAQPLGHIGVAADGRVWIGATTAGKPFAPLEGYVARVVDGKVGSFRRFARFDIMCVYRVEGVPDFTHPVQPYCTGVPLVSRLNRGLYAFQVRVPVSAKVTRVIPLGRVRIVGD